MEPGRNLRAGRSAGRSGGTAGRDDEVANTDWIYDARWSPDGKLIATAGQDGTVRLWDAATGKTVRKIDLTKLTPRMKSTNPGNTGHLRAVRFLGDGRSLAVAADTHPIRIFDVASGEPVAEIPYAVPDTKWEQPRLIAITTSGLIIGGCFGGALLVYDVTPKTERYRLPATPNAYPRFAVSEVEGLLANTVPEKDRSVIVQMRSLETGKAIGDIEAKAAAQLPPWHSRAMARSSSSPSMGTPSFMRRRTGS